MSDFSLIANSGIQFHSLKVNLGMKSAAMKVSGDYYEKMEEDIEGNAQLVQSTVFLSIVSILVRNTLT